MSRALQQLRFVASANVFKAGTFAGTLTRTHSGTVEFTYSPDYEDRGDPVPVATTLPVDGRVHSATGGALPAFFAGLLPEGHRLTVVRTATKTSLDDELTLLMAVGSDVPGDVQIIPADALLTEPKPLADTTYPETLNFAELAGRLDLSGTPGVQDKVSASMLSAPVSMGSGKFILKLNPPGTPHLVDNEAIHLVGARALRIPVASATVVHDRQNVSGLLVTRFDRLFVDDRWRRLALEDATQVIGLPPASKYTVTAEEAVRALANVCAAPLVAVRNLYLQFVFAWLTGNGDLHAKNVSVLSDLDRRVSIAPMYDIPCTLVYGDDSLALSVAGRTTKLRTRHWSEFADAIGLPQRAAQSANSTALKAARSIDLTTSPFTGSVVAGAQRELRHRRHELDP